ncbi:phosphate propanoyltransferase [Clostridium sp. PL3]|uniref:Phosphate propanoyltransferase n=1 Tax=Clostridium thailandense TaxID=2794346 RepID=A0A949X0M0_9CLOT|nr:phosphate propanoyltransferase [Clostridium thailandense]MBV7271324.1 phosphate propanoyltransferase [Clostridium thailandense]
MELDEIIKRVVEEVKKAECPQSADSDAVSVNDSLEIPVGVSNRHIHLSQDDLEVIFGKNTLTSTKDLSQPGQFACEEFVTLVGPKGTLEKVRVLGPVRAKTQVEILASDCFKLGVKAPICESGKLHGTPGIAVVGTKGCVQLKEGVIIAQRHIHMTEADAKIFDVIDGQCVKIEFNGIRAGVLDQVLIRVSDKSKLDCHLDIDEANCLSIKNNDKVRIVK